MPMKPRLLPNSARSEFFEPDRQDSALRGSCSDVSLHHRLPAVGEVLDHLSRHHARNAPYSPDVVRGRRSRERRQMVLVMVLALLAVVAAVLTLLLPRGDSGSLPSNPLVPSAVSEPDLRLFPTHHLP